MNTSPIDCPIDNRIVTRMQSLRAAGQSGIAPYVTAGDGGLDTTLAVLRALDRAGACTVELGVPFSDPIADGPVLQAAAERALAAGTNMQGILDLLRRLRAGSDGEPPCELPVALFSYANPLFHCGLAQSARAVAEAGGDGFLVPDIPVEEGDELRAVARANNLCSTFFVAPTSTPERVQAAAEASTGFLYAIGRIGVTGASTELDAEALAFLARVREHSTLPLAVGFGLRTAEQVRAVTAVADVAIVGSSMVQLIHEAYTAGGQVAAAREAGRYLHDLQGGKEPSSSHSSPA